MSRRGVDNQLCQSSSRLLNEIDADMLKTIRMTIVTIIAMTIAMVVSRG